MHKREPGIIVMTHPQKTKRIFLVARRITQVSHILAASLDELFQLLLLFCQRRHFGCQLLSLAQTPLHFQQTAAPVWKTTVSKQEPPSSTDIREKEAPQLRKTAKLTRRCQNPLNLTWVMEINNT